LVRGSRHPGLPEIGSFDEFVNVFLMALDKTLPFRHWSRETMMSPAARAAWSDPDLPRLP